MTPVPAVIAPFPCAVRQARYGPGQLVSSPVPKTFPTSPGLEAGLLTVRPRLNFYPGSRRTLREWSVCYRSCAPPGNDAGTQTHLCW